MMKKQVTIYNNDNLKQKIFFSTLAPSMLFACVLFTNHASAADVNATATATIDGDISFINSSNNSVSNKASINFIGSTFTDGDAIVNITHNYNSVTITNSSNIGLGGIYTDMYTKSELNKMFRNQVYPFISSAVALSGLQFSPLHVNSVAVSYGNLMGRDAFAIGGRIGLGKKLFLNVGVASSTYSTKSLASTAGMAIGW